MKNNKRLISESIVEKADEIAELLNKGKDVEIRTAKDGITIIEVSKKVMK